MKKNVTACIATTDSKGVPYQVRLKKLRETTGKSPEEMASMVGVSISEYYDLESCDAELNTAVSLGKLSMLSSVLAVPTSLVFEDKRKEDSSITCEQLCARIKTHLITAEMSIAKFEERVGFVIEPALRDSSEVLNWNVDCLRSVSQELEIDWLAALP
jgi:transcriptional regulator with XRE-family HTH domain